MTQTADRYGKVLYDLRVPAEDVEQMLGRMSEKGVPVTEVKIDRITGKKYGFCWDPTGTKIEFYER